MRYASYLLIGKTVRLPRTKRCGASFGAKQFWWRGTGGPTGPRHVQRDTPCSENTMFFYFWSFLCGFYVSFVCLSVCLSVSSFFSCKWRESSCILQQISKTWDIVYSSIIIFNKEKFSKQMGCAFFPYFFLEKMTMSHRVLLFNKFKKRGTSCIL